MRLILFFSFLLIPLSLGAMDGDIRDHSSREGLCYKMFASAGRVMVGGFFRSAAREVDVAGLSTEFIDQVLGKVKNQMENGGNLNAAICAFGDGVKQNVVKNVGDAANK